MEWVTEQNELKPQAVAGGPARHSSPIETPLQQTHSVALSIAAGPPVRISFPPAASQANSGVTLLGVVLPKCTVGVLDLPHTECKAALAPREAFMSFGVGVHVTRVRFD